MYMCGRYNNMSSESSSEAITSATIMQIVSYTLCVDSYDVMRKCADKNQFKTVADLIKSKKCTPSWTEYAKCRDEKTPEVVQWCLSAEGCDKPREAYFACMKKNGADRGKEETEKAHDKCLVTFEGVLSCGATFILKQLDSQNKP